VVLGTLSAVSCYLLEGDVGFWHRQLRHAPLGDIDLVHMWLCDPHAGGALYQNPIDGPISARSKWLMLGGHSAVSSPMERLFSTNQKKQPPRLESALLLHKSGALSQDTQLDICHDQIISKEGNP